jgi:hypothetical protein
MKYLFLTLTSKRHDHNGNFTIERCDLTRKIDCLNTWVPEVLDAGHDVLFFDGGNDKQKYNPDSLTLHLTESDEYEQKPLPSILLPKIQSAFRWVLENKDFDYVYLHDDDIYININEFNKLNVTQDFKGTNIGGFGFFFNKKAMQALVEYKNEEKHSVADHAIYDCIRSNNSVSKIFSMMEHGAFYIPAELYATVHYVCGKRCYFLNNILRSYRDNGFTNRKIIFNFPFSGIEKNSFVTYEVEINRKTRRDYDFTVDKNNWEYHCGYARSSIINVNSLREFWPYAKNSAKYFVVNISPLLRYHEGASKEDLKNYLINKFEESLINKDNLLLCSDLKDNKDIPKEWKLNNSVKDSLKLNFENLVNYNFYTRK